MHESRSVLRSIATPGAVIDLVRLHWDLAADGAQLFRSLVNDVWRVTAGERAYALKIYRAGRWTADQVAWEQDLARHLERSGLGVAAIVPLRDRSLVGVADAPEGARPITLSAWSAAPKPRPPFDDDLYRSFGALLARFHDAADEFSSEHPARAFDLHSAVDAPRAQLVDAFTALDRTEDAELVEAVGTRASEALRMLERDGLRRGIRHGDASLDNLLVAPNGLLLHDFDLSAHSWPAADLVGALSTPFADAFLAGYQSVRALQDAELAALPHLRASELIQNIRSHVLDKTAIRGIESIGEGWVDAELAALRGLRENGT